MVFTSPFNEPKLTFDMIPDNISLFDFIFDPRYGRATARNPAFIDSSTGEERSLEETRVRTLHLAQGMFKVLGDGKFGEQKFIGTFYPNLLEVPAVTWATHRLGWTVTPANPAYTSAELAYQLKHSEAKALFTFSPMLETAVAAAKEVGIPEDQIFVLDQAPGFKSVQDLVDIGRKEKELPALNWSPGDGKTKMAFLSYSSGTTGLPKGVMVSHYNVIANTLQIVAFNGGFHKEKTTVLGLLPFYHIYGLVVILHAECYSGNTVVLVPKFELEPFVSTLVKYKIAKLFLVPPLVIRLVKDPYVRPEHLAHVKECFSGAAPLGPETQKALRDKVPGILFRQGYGMTETATVVVCSHETDQWDGSAGSSVQLQELKLVDPTSGKEVTEYDTPGELLVKGPQVTLGYYKNEKATAETFLEGGWIRTGDECVIRKSPQGFEHLFVVDRIKELIKVKGMQVAPAELEECLLAHPKVADAAVIGIPDERSGEVPKAYVVLHKNVPHTEETKRELAEWVQKQKARFKRLQGGIEFLEIIPKTASGKILRRELRERHKMHDLRAKL
ncbi:acetyl-CoA synthetase-like protein [Saitoella complicata NRRL Y-17804]|uniref:4-coumarate--CoA ligase n=1 Tax=Saitoella complicata (strain BCRC 22490 / CBS 7301 / JCM 7358 / NBRC 10748 / NRRL Y-17804) TaxID=698492 RepID=A0A0E9NKG1_SAICN|nr:acetyl-CoA synthetase-like protein [Saitoella complicata NRRL Y-17804]ODQ50261.1 acetyl-CoA synthetase-like protein [Saitoella complicata NRRL Y-17804]GAO50186.1 hypothetical protein G7K_4320-t1 [Saitoella complicata NRRL Y-17804]